MNGFCGSSGSEILSLRIKDGFNLSLDEHVQGRGNNICKVSETTGLGIALRGPLL